VSVKQQVGSVDLVGMDRLIVRRWSRLAAAAEQLAGARSQQSIVDILRATARKIVGADGIAIILRDADQCQYIAEDSFEPLWAGQRFPAEHCVSGWAMQRCETVVIPDIEIDPRVPLDAYRTTFVKSMVMVPIGRPEASAALGAYWSEVARPSENEIALLEAIARIASTALANARLLVSMEELNVTLGDRVAERTAKLQEAHEILRQAQKMEIIGQLTGNVAHDFNNLLAPIMGNLDLVLRRSNEVDRVHRPATIAMEAAERARILIQRLLAFARRQPLSPTAVDLGELAAGTSDLLQTTLGPRISLDIDIGSRLPRVKADRHQLEMAILNLAVNARDAMPAGGSLKLSARMASEDSLPADIKGEFVCLSIVDDGVGMDADTAKRAIEPFFTTKSTGNGTGLGLSMVHGLVAQLGGSMEISSKIGYGTQIELWLPVLRQIGQAPTEASLAEPATDSEGLILIIDDEPIVRMSTAEMLADLGYRFVEAGTAQEGLTLIEEGLAPDMVITDHIMPGMTGAELALRLRIEHPEIAILIISGYQGIDLIAPDVVRLSKPFRQAHLAASIAAALDQVRR
jgi:signal transduction histidine kinase